jgi:hypothetical protein
MMRQSDGARGQKPYSRPVLVKGPVLSAVTAGKVVVSAN